MFKNVHDVCKLVLGGTSVPKPILLTFRGRKMVKICGKFKVKTSWYYSPRTNQGPLRRTLARWSQHYLGSVHTRKGNRWGVC